MEFLFVSEVVSGEIQWLLYGVGGAVVVFHTIIVALDPKRYTSLAYALFVLFATLMIPLLETWIAWIGVSIVSLYFVLTQVTMSDLSFSLDRELRHLLQPTKWSSDEKEELRRSEILSNVVDEDRSSIA